jgi:hypothetical protein
VTIGVVPSGKRASLVAVTAADQSAFRFSGERPRPRESTAVRLTRPDVLLRHLGVQDRPQVSTIVVSTALAAGLGIRGSDVPLASVVRAEWALDIDE